MVIDPNIEVNTEQITKEEIGLTFQTMKSDRSLGPDGIPIESYKLFEEECRDILCDILSECWDREIMQDGLELSELVTLYKKGNVEHPVN